MPRFTVSKSIRIQAPAETVHASVRDFKQWPAWSPWLIAEPDSKLSYSDDGKGYAWDGKITGSGEMEVIKDDPPHEIRSKLTFLKPWKSICETSFFFKPSGDGTEVTWTMNGSLPIFMFWMSKMMSAFIGMDYERGLTMLKQHIEGGEVLSKLAFPGIQSYPGCRYVGIRATCSIDEIGPAMQRDMARLVQWCEQSKTTPSAPPISIYHQWKPVARTAEYTLAFPVETAPSSLPDGLINGELPECNCYVVRHTGPYPQLGNAWSAGMMHGRANVFSQKRGIPPFELYHNDPTETPESELITLVHFPAKS
ncbi:SRPBCC family protein [Haloferula chungangensis]|uniref:SRPBCC family protein n=1 Tax=Haloferula chungangensis TaxID=1048331 RepID=A0ABW2L9F6_9BACT